MKLGTFVAQKKHKLMNNIIIREATPKDASFIAQVVAMAIRDEETLCNYCGKDYLKVLAEVAAATATQYSYQNALVAETEQGELVGGVVGYDGALLNALRTGTWNIIKKNTSNVPTMTDETSAGEFYLDSLAVMPAYRGHGVGEKLILKLTEKAFAEGHKKVGLIVDKDNPRAEALYANIGFERVGERDFFEHQMYHLQMSVNCI